MDFVPAELIRKKRFGGTHTRAELHAWIQGYTQGEIADYQMSAWLMAVCLSGMNNDETLWLTEEMRDSGQVLDLQAFGVSVDKHSTGGLGDKTSLLLAPIVACAGIVVPMMAGRGLAHTGGTLDKLESLKGFNVNLDFAAFLRQLGQVGAAIIGQTAEICPADRKLYALRDVTGTVDSLPLICASILSKKLAEGMSALVLDVKFGSGAFMKSLGDARTLAKTLAQVCSLSGKKVRALLTRMDEPLGRYIGNALEVREVLDLLSGLKAPTSKFKGKDYSDTLELTLQLASHMIFMGGKAGSVEQALKMATEILGDGRAKLKFEEMCLAQGADLSVPLPIANSECVVAAERDGFFNYHDLEKIGMSAVHLGAGRKLQGDALDFSAGIEVLCTQGEKVHKNQPLFVLYSSAANRFDVSVKVLKESFVLADAPATRSPLIAEVI